ACGRSVARGGAPRRGFPQRPLPAFRRPRGAACRPRRRGVSRARRAAAAVRPRGDGRGLRRVRARPPAALPADVRRARAARLGPCARHRFAPGVRGAPPGVSRPRRHRRSRRRRRGRLVACPWTCASAARRPLPAGDPRGHGCRALRAGSARRRPLRGRGTETRMSLPPLEARLAAFYFAFFSFSAAYVAYFPAYLAGRGFSAANIALILALPQLARIAAPAAWGALADRTGAHRGIVILSCAAMTAGFVLLPLAESVALVALLVCFG